MAARFVLLLILAAACQGAHAQVVTYSSAVTTPAGGTFTSGAGTVQFSGQSPISVSAAGPGSNVSIALVAITAEPSGGGETDTFNDAYVVYLAVAYKGDTQNVVFTGTLSGSVAYRQSNLSVASNESAQTVTAGGQTFLVTYKDFSPPSVAGASPGEITGHIQAVATPPFTVADVMRAASIAAGLSAASAADLARLNVEKANGPTEVIDIRDVVGVLRKAAGVDVNP